MSFCRWSTDNFKCDLYCYESSQGFVTHIAGRRRCINLPDADQYWPDDLKKWGKVHAEQMEILNNIDDNKGYWEDITLPHANESFVDPDLDSFLSRLIYLKKLGYIFPTDLIPSIRNEIDNQTVQPMPDGTG